MRNKNYKSQSKIRRNKKRLIIVVTLVAIGGLATILYLKYHHTYTAVPTIETTASSSPPATINQNKSQAAAVTPVASTKQTENTTPAAANNLKMPSGTFVSNHSPSLSSSSSEVSVCSTSVGATCEIQLTQDSTTHFLTAKATDNDGNVTWTWDIKTAGLKVGKWQITVIAKLGNNTLSANDTLDVQL